MKIIIYGNGWLAGLMRAYFGVDCCVSTHRLEDHENFLLNEIEKYDVVINCAAKTNIDWCEKNKIQTLKDNVIGAVKLAEICQKLNTKYVFISSACIFESQDKTDIKYEDSIPNPKCFYAESKVLAEKLILDVNPDALIIRPRLPLSEIPHPRNTINKLLSYDKINTAQESVTVIEDMLPVLKSLIEKNKHGVFHLVNEGTISPAEIAGMFKHDFYLVDKEEQNDRLKREGRAKRVTTYVGSNKIKLLPHIKNRMSSLVKSYQENADSLL